MADCILPENPQPDFILKWLERSFSMDVGSLAWMFQTSTYSIRAWMKGRRVSHDNLMKLRKSYFFLNGTIDPHAGDRICDSCGAWKPAREIKNGLCSDCIKT